MDNTNTAARWDSAADNYQQVFSLGINEYNAAALRFLQERGLIFPGARVLDIGCGVGKYGTYLSALGCRVTLSDISPKMLEHARANLAPWPETEFVCGDFAGEIFSGEEQTGRYDLVMSTMSPAITTAGTLRKACRLSRGGVYLTNFVSWRQSLRDELIRRLGPGTEARFDRGNLQADHEALLSMLESCGVKYELDYVPYDWSDSRTPEEMADYMLRSLGLNRERQEIIAAARGLADENGILQDKVETMVARIIIKCEESV